MKILVFLICIGAAVYFFCFKKSSDPTPAPAPKTVKAPVVEKDAVDIKAKFSAEAKFKKNSLGDRLAELHNANDFLFDNSQRIKIPQTPVNEIRQELQRCQQTLQHARDLQKYDDLGMVEFYIFSALKHVGIFQRAVRVLACSGLVEASAGNNKQAVEDFNAAGKILNVFMAGSSCFVEMFTCKRYAKYLENAINNSSLSKDSKQAILNKLPGKKDWVAAFPRMVAWDKSSGLQIKTYLDAGGEMSQLGMDVAKLEILKKISRSRWEELLNKSQDFICSECEKGTLSKDTKINVGTEKENMVLQETFVIQGYIRFLN